MSKPDEKENETQAPTPAPAPAPAKEGDDNADNGGAEGEPKDAA